VVLLGERHLRVAARDFIEHYHRERNHQGLDNQLIETHDKSSQPPIGVKVGCHERLGGMLRYYYGVAA
jgi:putative transposase